MMSNINIEKLVEKFDTIIDSIKNENRKNQIKMMMEKIGSSYFIAPAAAKEEYHDAFPGGLLYHTLKVYSNMNRMCKMFYPDIDNDSIIITSLFHDLGKACTVSNQEIYIPIKEQWKLDRGINYELNPEIRDGLTHAQRSVRLLSFYGIELTEEEYLSILTHDGLFVDENICFKYKLNKLSSLLHFSDYFSVFHQG